MILETAAKASKEKKSEEKFKFLEPKLNIVDFGWQLCPQVFTVIYVGRWSY